MRTQKPHGMLQVDALTVCCRCLALVLLAGPLLLPAQPEPAGVIAQTPVRERLNEFLIQLPPLKEHQVGLTGQEANDLRRGRSNYRQILREKLAGSWFAALVSTASDEPNKIVGRFPTWKGFADFIVAREALVELWTYGESGSKGARRVPATEAATLRQQRYEQPLFVTLTYLEAESGKVLKYRVEFGFGAASEAFAAQQSYASQRALQAAARRILSARAPGGRFSALAQWKALRDAMAEDLLSIEDVPPMPANTNDLFVAAEFEVDEGNYVTRLIRLWRESEIAPQVVNERGNDYVQVLALTKPGTTKRREVRAFAFRGLSDKLEPVPAPLPGRDAVELRVVAPNRPDPRTWNVLEFGEPEVLTQVSIAEFSLINAYLEKHRKEVALLRSKLNLYMEPIFAGLNIGCGLAAVPFPVGEAARLGYNAAVTPWLIPPVPTVKQMRDLMRLVAARERIPGLKTKPGRYLTESDYKRLKKRAAEITEAQLNEYLERIQDEDIRAMLRLAKMAHLDDEITNLLNILTGAAKVSGWSDEPGLPRDILNSIYFSLNGEINLKNIIAVLAGARDATPYSGVSLNELAKGQGPLLAWLQYLDVTVDVRAVANTISRLFHRNLADKELKMPFPYATRMSDIAAYEIRIFGYPLLMYYRRGLLKDDYAAFQNDYAYGLITTRIVEHFRTRDEMDAEIRAGRMIPLGFVRVPDLKGRWKESNLAVFAHRIPAGRYAGKTAIIIYGLKAYAEQSQLMRREYDRIKHFEEALEEGGVIEQLLNDSPSDWVAGVPQTFPSSGPSKADFSMPSQALEPTIHVGTNASATLFSPLLGNLLEWRRHLQRCRWGLSESEPERRLTEQVQSWLQSRGIAAQEWTEDPLVAVDTYNSRFLYRRTIDGRVHTFKVVNIPSRAEILNALQKAAEGQRIEELRKENLGERGHGLALVNEALRVGQSYETGPLLRDASGKVEGAGVLAGRDAVESVLTQIDLLPVSERAAAHSRDFTGILLDLRAFPGGENRKVFVTLEFPMDTSLERTLTNQVSGLKEVRTYADGQLVKRLTSREITELEYDGRGNEITTRAFWNAGTLETPVKGELLEITRTLEVWRRGDGVDLDPYQPTVTEVRVNYITGLVTRETYGLFSFPVIRADDQYVVSNRFNRHGIFASATVRDNGESDEDFLRPWQVRVLDSRPGKVRFELASVVPAAELEQQTDAAATGYRTTIIKRDVVKGINRRQSFDNAVHGRQISESWEDPIGPDTTIITKTTNEYADDFCYGLVPRAVTKTGALGTDLSRTITLSYDAFTRRLTALEQLLTGSTSTNVWDSRWDGPVTFEASGRRTELRYNREATSQTSTTTVVTTGEEIATGTGEFDITQGLWRISREYYHRPGIKNGAAIETRSPFGTLISVQTGDAFRSRPVYDQGGIERSRQVFGKNPASGQFDVLQRIEDDYTWQQGRRDARVRTFVDGLPYDVYRTRSDRHGRTEEDGIRKYPGLSLLNRITYDGDSLRVLRVEEMQNGAVRLTHLPQREESLANGQWVLPVTVIPRWGLASTQTFLLGGPLGRPLTTRVENGDTIKVREWFPNTSIARVAEVEKSDGRVVERIISTLNSGTNGVIPYDRNARYRISFWEAAGLEAEEATVRGTEVALFSDVADERLFFDSRKDFKAPLYCVDPSGYYGVVATVLGSKRTNVLALFNTGLQSAQSRKGTTNSAEILRVERIDLRGLFFHRVTEQVLDRSGHLLQEVIGRIPNAGAESFIDVTAFDGPRITLARFKPQYHVGWFVESPNKTSGGRSLAFTNKPPQAGQRGYRVNAEGFPETITLTEGKVFGSTGESEAARFRDFFFRRVHNVRFLEHNIHMPGVFDCWSASTRTDFGPDGSRLFDLEIMFDAQGRLRVEKAVKRTGSSANGTRIAYQAVAPELDGLEVSEHAPGTHTVRVATGERSDFAGSDFLYLYVNGVQGIELVIADGNGQKATVQHTNSDFENGVVPVWRVHPMHVRWLPDDVEPRQGTELFAPAGLHRSGNLFSFSVQDLVRAGLSVSDLRSFDLVFSNATPVRLSRSRLYAMDRDGPLVEDVNQRQYAVKEIDHSSGLRTVLTADRDRARRDFYTGQRMDALIEFNGLPVATVRCRGRLDTFPHLLWLDNSDPDLSRPLYALSGSDGHFLEYYQLLRPGDAHLYVAPQTFEVPRLEIYRAAVLQDELYPGMVGYGRDYKLTIPSSRRNTALGRAEAMIMQRVSANAFRFKGAQLAEWLRRKAPEGDLTRGFNYLRFQEASTRAREITALPTPAQVLAGMRDLPWPAGLPTGSSAVPFDRRRLGASLGHLQMKEIEGELAFPTRLIPTSPNTDTERYIDTVKEADLIVLALKLGELKLAEDILSFYRVSSGGGQEALFASYDAKARTGMATDVRHERPGQSKPTAEAQLAIADAAFYLGFETGEARWLSFGRNLLALTLDKFRLPRKEGTIPQGITDFPAYQELRFLGIRFWPEAATYSLASNARAYLLLKRLVPLATSRFRDLEWRSELMQALHDQEDFLKTRVLPEVERTGGVPAGLFEIQDLEQGSSALAAQRWTTAEDWLWFLEAAPELGVPLATCRQWLDNLARVHGVQVPWHGVEVWGIDWRLALLRHDAISPDMTARFLRVATRLQHRPAQAFAARNLNLMRRNDVFPIAITDGPRDYALTTGKDFTVQPWTDLRSWPRTFGLFRDLVEIENYGWDPSRTVGVLETLEPERLEPRPRTDLAVFILIAGGLYLSVLGSTLFWWGIRALRRRKGEAAFSDPAVPEGVMQRAEERWAKRVLGAKKPLEGEHWRYSNAAVEANFLAQFRAAYKVILEWRRLENGWREDDERLVESATDPWLNGADELAVVIGIYMRCVIKAGTKDGFSRPDVLAENEDSNHIWARLTLFFSEHLWSLAAAVYGWRKTRGGPEERDYRAEIEQTLDAMGVRRRLFGFDARELFDFPDNPYAMDLLVVQRPDLTLTDVMRDMALKLDIPLEHIRKVVGQYKEFKRREQPYPIHPYLVEYAKELPHFTLMALGAIVLYNQTMGDSPIVAYLKTLFTGLALKSESLRWALPLVAGVVLTVLAHFVRVYRFGAAIRPREKPGFLLDATVTSLFVKRHKAEPGTHIGRWSDPGIYERWAWALRSLGCLMLALVLLRIPTPSFTTFLVVKGVLAMLVIGEVLGVVLPLATSALSKFIQDRVRSRRWYAFLNRFNITSTRPASPLWLSVKYSARPSMPTGTPLGLVQAVAFYFLLAASFFFGAGYLCQQVFPLWFTETYLLGADFKLLLGGVVFGVTMVLFRYGLFLFFTSIASFFAAFPVLSVVGLAALIHIVLVFLAPTLDLELNQFAPGFWGLTAFLMGVAMCERRISRWLHAGADRREHSLPGAVDRIREARLGVVYMSGDDLSGLKLTPDLLMTRWTLLRDRLGSSVVPILHELAEAPDDEELRACFHLLYDAERRADVTLWHPSQLFVEGAPDHGRGRFTLESGLNISVPTEARRQKVITAWHIRRWLACVMSTAGHSQDTAINLADMALRFHEEGLSEQVAFYLVQNKYDSNPHNRPSQTPYDQGEFAQRNKLARLLCALAPGVRAYCLQNWTPFGFKAGGLTGMDLVYEESLRLSTMLLLDRNATVHDLDGLMRDVREAMADPNLVIVIPGRSTTNTLTPIGQASQLVEEGHRSFLRGLLSVLGGDASEAVGTGWGNLLACFYGRVQHALVCVRGRKMALTSRMLRGTSFVERTEGLIGFGPHAVGISEDIWAVVQAMNTALGLRLRPRFALSRAMWHKIRETWSHAEWLSSFPRWAGGYFQMVHDPLMQRIYDFGPQSVFARELRSNSGRSFLSAPLALLSILMMPLAIIFDVSPFVQTLVVLWNCGFVLNQVLTLHALNAYLEGCGFSRATAMLGAAAGAAVAWLVPACGVYGPGLVLGGMLLGGFFVGLSRWLVTRARDLALFGPQLVLHALSQAIRLSLEFTVSGTSAEDARHVNMAFRSWVGPREDRPLERFPSFLNLRTVIWGFGLLSLVLCVFALTRLDMLNVLLLLPSLVFSVSILVGPFLLTPAPGAPLGMWIVIPRLLGWLVAGFFYTMVSLGIAQGSAGRWLALLLFAVVIGLLLRRALRYVAFRQGIQRHRKQLLKLLAQAGTARPEILVEQILHVCVASPDEVPVLLRNAGVVELQKSPILDLVHGRIVPLLRSPVVDLQEGVLARSRWVTEWSRSFVFAVLVLLWFFLVPVPGLTVFTWSYPESYRFTAALEGILTGLGWAVLIILIASWIGGVIQRIRLTRCPNHGLARRLQRCYVRLSELRKRLTDAQVSSVLALLTDSQIYIDQRSYAYATRSVEQAEWIIGGDRSRAGWL